MEEIPNYFKTLNNDIPYNLWMDDKSGTIGNYEISNEIGEVHIRDNTTYFPQIFGSEITNKYYDSGNAIRVYGGNTFTVSTSNGMIRTITLTLNGNGNEITVVKGTLSGTTWTGDESSITFFVEGTSGHVKVVSIAISYLPA